jgi:tetratricopeptide (TPR) repeat protein
VNEKDNKDKLEELRRAHVEQPDSKEAAVQLAQFYVDLGWFNDALDLYRELTTRHHGDYVVMLEYANVCYRRQDYGEAVRVLTELTVTKPERIEGWNNLGIALLACKKDGEAKRAFGKVLDLEPDNPGALLNMGNYRHQCGDLPGAAELFERDVRVSPDFADAWYNLGNVYRDQKEFPKAIEAYQKALRYQPTFGSALKNLGFVQEQSGDLAAAEKCYKEALASSKTDASLYTNLGYICSRQRRYEEAKDYFLRAVRVAPRELSGWMGLRQLSLIRGDIATFVKATLSVISRLDSQTLAQTCRLLRELEHYGECETVLGRATDLKREGDELDVERLLWAQRGGKRDEALVAKLSAIAEPTDSLRIALAEYFSRAGEPAKALRMVRAATEDSLFRHRLLWRMLIACKEIDQAETEIKAYLDTHPDCSEAWYQLACVHVCRDDMVKARKDLLVAIENGFCDTDVLEQTPKLKALHEALLRHGT